jgi:hypothetical protein
MQIVKKNILSIICGVIVIAAVVAYFVFVSGSMYPDLEASAKERKSQYDSLNNLLGKKRTLPVVELKTTTPVDLPAFPTLPIIEKAKEVTTSLSAQSKQILQLAVKMNEHQPLVPGVFPKPNDTTKLMFRDAYVQYMKSGITQRLMAANPPTLEDVARAEQKLWDEKYAEKIYYVNGQEANREIVDREYLEEVNNLRETLERQTAENHRVYLDQTAVNTNASLMTGGASPPDAQVWYAQMAIWVQNDLVDSIASLNDRVLKANFKDPKDWNIINAPVKHVSKVNVPEGAEMYFRLTDLSIEGVQAGAQDFQSSPTGRTSGNVYDVIKFELIAKMDARYVPALIQEMARGKFITVHKVDTTSIDTTLARDEGFFYGNAPLVQVTLTGEALMLRDWTLKLVPEVVKKDLPGYTPAGEGAAVASAQ